MENTTSVGTGLWLIACKVKETEVLRDRERNAKCGRGDNDTDPECDESYFPARAMCGY
jgi:hypothetical protein